MKVVVAPLGADLFGDDLLLFEHGLLFGLETALEMAGGVSYADIHDQIGGADKRERPAPPLTEPEIRTLAARAQCDVLLDGMLMADRDPETHRLTEVSVALRLFFARDHRFETPEGYTFKAFSPGEHPEKLELDYDLYIALQYRLCEEMLDLLGLTIPRQFTADALQITPSWPAYAAFLKGKRITQIPETKLGYYEQALQHDPDFFWALYNSAMLYKTQTDYNSARKRLMHAASCTQDSKLLGDVYFELGLCSIYMGDPKTARNFWNKALEYAEDNPSLFVNIAGTYEQEENWAEAKRLNQEALERFPDHHKAIVNLARLHAMFGQLDQAIPLYERALELQPNDALRHSVLGGCYLAAERPDEARECFVHAVALDPESDPGKYAQQELDKLGPKQESPESGEEPKKKRWGLW